MVRRAVAIALVLTAVVAAPAPAAWNQPVGGASPISASTDGYSQAPSLTAIEGVPYVAWDEYDGVASKIRVARLNAAGTWERVGEATNPESPINQSPTRQAYNPSLTAIGGVPYVAWEERDSLRSKIRVARLNATGTAWEKVGIAINPASPINQSANHDAFDPSLIAIGDAPYVAWTEDDGTNDEIRVARLNAAGTGWEKVGQTLSPASPINQSAGFGADDPSLAQIDGVPYVAWAESDGSNDEIRVARLNAAATGWEKVPNASSPINESNGHNAKSPSLTAIGGVLHVAWAESDGTNDEVRAARLNAAGTGWEKVGQGASPASPINESASQNAEDPSLTAVDGVPYIAWREASGPGDTEIRVARLSPNGAAWEKVAGSASPINESPGEDGYRLSMAGINGVPFVSWAEEDAEGAQIRVSRLEPELISQSAAPSETGATLTATWRTFGLSYPLGFDYGAALEASTAPTPAATGSDTAEVSQPVGGLRPSTQYAVRPFALAGTPQPRVLGGVGSFTTAPDTTPPETKITKEPKAKSSKAKAKYRFTSSEPGSTFACKFDKRKFKPCDAGKAKFKRLDDGKHKFKVIATDAAGNADPSPAKDKFKVL